ncbi:hypothetical protein LCGC14_0370960 [marine sediment metagenome]|uniref:Uncharacterized protein n=1 Tax=marine sediment metagenome TaxID=412755 RepID=A0A0F9T5C7_9ZZZZ|nr:hypothetical protein [Maribacter sp.]HDZ04855.1 hypothetical protein [Maribacter sp.]
MSANIKVNRRILYEKVQEIIGNGVIEGEEVDLTSKKVLDEIWTIINFLNLPFKERLKAKMPSEKEIGMKWPTGVQIEDEIKRQLEDEWYYIGIRAWGFETGFKTASDYFRNKVIKLLAQI